MKGTQHKLSNSDALDYIIGERALYTIKNEQSGNRFTFKTKKAKTGSTLFISVLSGPDNTSDYRYIGYIDRNHNFNWSENSKVTIDAQSFKTFAWVYTHLRNNNLPDYISVFHYNTCARCGRVLTTDASIIRGIGPECFKMKARR